MNKVLIGILFLLLAAACAEQNEFDTTDFQQGAFARWMAKYHPDVPALDDENEGIYAQWFEKNPGGQRLRNGYWMEMDYTVRDQQGDIVYTRSRRDARLLFGSAFNHAIHYAPERIEYSPSSMAYSYAYGHIQVLEQMQQGDSVRLYLAPEWGYGGIGFAYSAENHYGYSPTSASVSASAGLIIDLRLNRVIKDINLYEREQVARWAVDSLGITDPADSIALGVYFKKQVENPAGDSVKLESTAQVYYTARFLDGHILDTNVDSVATAHKIAANTGPAAIVLQSFGTDIPNSTQYVQAMKAALLEMQSGERARFVFVSDQGFQSEGFINSSDRHIIVPAYTPLEYEIHIESVGAGEEDGESE